MPDTTGVALLSERRAPSRPSMVQMREIQRQEWRLRALGDYIALLVRLARRNPDDGSLMDRAERAIAEADRTQAQLDQMMDALDTATCEKRQGT